MSTQRRRSRGARSLVLQVESLENRQLLATSTGLAFSGPSLTGLITQAWEGNDTSRAAISTMLKALESQLSSGPLADLNSGAVDGNGFIQEAQLLTASYAQNVDQQLLPHFTNIDQLLKLQGQAVVTVLVALNQQAAAGLITSSDLATEAQTVINSLTNGPISSLGTPVSAYASVSQTFVSQVQALAQSLGSTSSTAPSIADVILSVLADAEAYRTELHVGLQVTHPNISNSVDQAVNDLESAVGAMDQTSSAVAQSQLSTALTAFNTAILGTSGLFGPQGQVSQVNAELGYIPHNLTVQREASTLDSVSGTSASAGLATLTATLTSATGAPIAGQVVGFTLDGAFAGLAATDANGVATLTGVPTSDTAGTTTGAVVASFPGSLQNTLSANAGDLVVTTQGSSTTTLASNTNPSISGQQVTLTATVAASSSGSGTPTGSVTFEDGTTTLGTGTLNSSGVATFSTSTLSTGTHSITAVYGGDTSFTTSTSTAVSQVVNQASTTSTLSSSVNPSVLGQQVTFTANVAAVSPGTGAPTGTVNFLDGGLQIGTGTLNSSGVASFSTSTLSVATHPITAVYTGDANFTTSASTAVSQVVNQADTTSTLVSSLNPSPSGQSVTFTATVAPALPGTGTPTGTVNFFDGATQIGTNTLSGGVATFSTNALTTGTHSITAVYVGTTSFKTSTSNAVSQVVS